MNLKPVVCFNLPEYAGSRYQECSSCEEHGSRQHVERVHVQPGVEGLEDQRRQRLRKGEKGVHFS